MKVNDSSIALNSRVQVELVDASEAVERLDLTIVDTRRADFKSGLLDENTAPGRLLLGHRAGETLAYTAGDLRAARILSVEQNNPAPAIIFVGALIASVLFLMLVIKP